MSVSQFVRHTLHPRFKHLCSPTSQSPMSNFFRYSESLGKSAENKWSQVWIFLLQNGCKSPWRKEFFLGSVWSVNSLRRLITALFHSKSCYTARALVLCILGEVVGVTNMWQVTGDIFFFFFLFGIGATNRRGREIQCLPYARFVNFIVISWPIDISFLWGSSWFRWRLNIQATMNTKWEVRCTCGTCPFYPPKLGNLAVGRCQS